MSKVEHLHKELQAWFGDSLLSLARAQEQLTLEIAATDLLKVSVALRDESPFLFDTLVDVCGVDYLHYGQAEWATEETSETGFGRAVDSAEQVHQINSWEKPRFAVVYHLLSTTHNHRLRLRVFAEGEPPRVASVVDIWNAANWFERECFDLFGILFEGHPDLRRLLTDYGFIGHPLRKDFPVSGHVEMRYDATQERVIYEPVAIEPRVLVPKVIRQDNRYEDPFKQEAQDDA